MCMDIVEFGQEFADGILALDKGAETRQQLLNFNRIWSRFNREL